MRRILFFMFLFTLGASFNSVLAQQHSVRGVITDATTKEPLIGATVVIKGTGTGTVANIDGEYQLNASPEDILEYSYVGMETHEELVGNRTVIDVALAAGAFSIDEVVVTAMGIERKSKSLTYATEQVSGNELTRAKDPSMINSLQGKTAGLNITPNATGAGGSSRIILRGNKSVWGNNEPLIVIDGIPMNNPKTTQLSGEYEGRDGGSALSNLNPDDIASMSVLKGASAAALYGSMAANGVIMINTKKGREGAIRVDFSSNITLESPLLTPELQSRYGAVKSGDKYNEKSWGDKITGDTPGKDRVNDFFRTGSTYINSITLNGGTETTQSFLSYANTTALGIMPTNDFMRHNMSARQSFNLYDNKLNIDATLSYITEKGNNRPHGGTYNNPLTGLYTFPANADFNHYKENYEVYDGGRNLMAQNWYTGLNDFTGNPYWMLNRTRTQAKRDRIMASGIVSYKLTDDLNVQGRLSIDNTSDDFQQKWHATTVQVWAPGGNGRYKHEEFTAKQLYGDLMANYSKEFADTWELNASVGTSFMDSKIKTTYLDSDKLGLMQPNYFVPENIKGNPNQRAISPEKRLNSVFGTLQVGYKGKVYVDVTGRNDWSSTLAFTDNVSFFYPSVGLTGLINEIVPMHENVDLFKLRGSYSVVGNDVPAYITYPMDGINHGQLEPNTKAPFGEMKPEKMHSMEFGLDLNMFNNRFNFDITYYKTNNKNQYFEISSPIATGYNSYYINAGDIQNSGFESSIGYRWVFNSDLSWSTNYNISYNKNEIKKLDDRLSDGVEIGSGAGYRFMITEGGSFGDVYSRKIKRDANGVIELTANGAPVVESEQTYLGNVNPDWTMGWSNNVYYKDFNLYLLVDGKIGGNTIGMTQSYLDSYGVTKATADARDNGGVDIGNGTKIDAQTYYEAVAGKDKAGAEYFYSATNFRLREVSLGYTFRNLIQGSKDLSLSFVARNLFFIYKDSPHDPDMSVSTNNAYQKFDTFGLPATRSYGLNLKVSF